MKYNQIYKGIFKNIKYECTLSDMIVKHEIPLSIYGSPEYLIFMAEECIKRMENFRHIIGDWTFQEAEDANHNLSQQIYKLGEELKIMKGDI